MNQMLGEARSHPEIPTYNFGVKPTRDYLPMMQDQYGNYPYLLIGDGGGAVGYYSSKDNVVTNRAEIYGLYGEKVTADDVMANGVMQAGVIVAIGGGPEDIPADIIAGVRITAAAIVAGTYLLSDHLQRSEDNKGAELDDLPALDGTGKVHGKLPGTKTLGRYSKEDLEILRQELEKSIQRRIRVTSNMGRDRGHGQRQGAEQDLLKKLERHLQNREK